jgi:hypothetical protein
LKDKEDTPVQPQWNGNPRSNFNETQFRNGHYYEDTFSHRFHQPLTEEEKLEKHQFEQFIRRQQRERMQNDAAFFHHAANQYRAMHIRQQHQPNTSWRTGIVHAIVQTFTMPLQILFDHKSANTAGGIARKMFALLKLSLNVFIVYIATSFLYQLARSKFSGIRNATRADGATYYLSGHHGASAHSPNMPKSERMRINKD